MTDDDEVAEFEQDLAEVRARAAASSAATEAIETDPIGDVVVARFDTDGVLTDLYMDPTALKRYTNIRAGRNHHQGAAPHQQRGPRRSLDPI